DPTRYRLSDELEEWKLKDPIERVRAFLARGGYADQAYFDSVQADADAFAADLREYTFNMPEPPPERIFSNVYAEGNPVLDTPLAESGIIGTAVGLAVRGFRPVCEIQFEGFIFPGFDQISSQLAKLHYRTQGKVKMPVVIRVPFGGGIGAVEHHSESPESLFAHVAGLKVVSCSNPVDAYWMIQQAIGCDDPVLFFEPKRLYHSGTLRADVDVAAKPDPLF